MHTHLTRIAHKECAFWCGSVISSTCLLLSHSSEYGLTAILYIDIKWLSVAASAWQKWPRQLRQINNFQFVILMRVFLFSTNWYEVIFFSIVSFAWPMNTHAQQHNDLIEKRSLFFMQNQKKKRLSTHCYYHFLIKPQVFASMLNCHVLTNFSFPIPCLSLKRQNLFSIYLLIEKIWRKWNFMHSVANFATKKEAKNHIMVSKLHEYIRKHCQF